MGESFQALATAQGEEFVRECVLALTYAPERRGRRMEKANLFYARAFFWEPGRGRGLAAKFASTRVFFRGAARLLGRPRALFGVAIVYGAGKFMRAFQVGFDKPGNVGAADTHAARKFHLIQVHVSTPQQDALALNPHAVILLHT